MIDHLGIQVSDVDAAAAVYLRFLAPLGIRELMRFPGPVVGLGGPDGHADFWLSPAGDQPVARENHVAFTAADRATVDAAHDAAVEAGLEILHEPKEWPMYHPGYYGVFVRDLDGNNIEAVFHGDGTRPFPADHGR